ncbi:MAG: chromate transporter [Oscillospiraceae bacterium]|nr:chromate transporter [Oscillospiraceae bacterium]
MSSRLKQLWQIFAAFFRIGAFTFGGGLAMIPLIQKEAVEKHGWVSDDDILEIVAIAESTPGPIAINAATFVGYRAAGVLGSAFATFGTVLPSFVIILLISYVLRQFQQLPAVQYAFWGIRAGVLAMLIKSLYTMFKKSAKGWPAYVAMAAAFVLTAVLDVHILIVIIGCAVFGLVTATLAERRAGK